MPRFGFKEGLQHLKNRDAESRKPVEESKDSISYLGIELPRAEKNENAPSRAQYEDYINDSFSLDLQKRIAVAWSLGEPFLGEGGTSIGKTTTVKKMCAELGYEAYYVNGTGAIDNEDIFGRYVPNVNRSNGDPEYVFADGQATSALRQEEGKMKVLIFDEINAAPPNVLIRLHSVLDALERGGEVVLTEDASERIQVSKARTKVIAFSNPPGQGFLQREPLDPAQLRRWVYQKLETELPQETLDHATKALFGLDPKGKPLSSEKYLEPAAERLSPEMLAEIPGIEQLLTLYLEFHQSMKKMVRERKIARDQPQRFTFDDREEPRRVRDFMCTFYRGDMNATIQEALRYFYAGKILDKDERTKVEEMVRQIHFTPSPPTTKRRGLEETIAPEKPEKAMRASGKFTGVDGFILEATEEVEKYGYKVGDALLLTGAGHPRRELVQAKSLRVAGFMRDGKIITQIDGDRVVLDDPRAHGKIFGKVPTTPEAPKVFSDEDGDEIIATGETEKFGYKVGDRLRVRERGILGEDFDLAEDIRIAGFTSDDDILVQVYPSYVVPHREGTFDKYFERADAAVKGPRTAFQSYTGTGIIEATGFTEMSGFKVGDKLKIKRGGGAFAEEIVSSTTLEVAGFTKDSKLIIKLDDGTALAFPISAAEKSFEREGTSATEGPRTFKLWEGAGDIESTGETEKFGYRIGDKLELDEHAKRDWDSDYVRSRTHEVVGFDIKDRVLVQLDDGSVAPSNPTELAAHATVVPAPEKSAPEKHPQTFKRWKGRGETISSTGESKMGKYRIGDRFEPDETAKRTWNPDLVASKTYEIVGFDSDRGQALVKVDHGTVAVFPFDSLDRHAKIIPASPERPSTFTHIAGMEVSSTGERSFGKYSIGDELVLTEVARQELARNHPETTGSTLKIVGFNLTKLTAIIQLYNGKVFTWPLKDLDGKVLADVRT